MAYLVGHRNGVAPVSDAYLSGFIEAGEPIERTLEVDRVMRAAGAVERGHGTRRRAWAEGAEGVRMRRDRVDAGPPRCRGPCSKGEHRRGQAYHQLAE